MQLCCVKCPKGYRPGANVRTCVLSFLSATRPFTTQRRCALRPSAAATLQLAPQPRPRADATCPAGSVLVTASGAATCKACSSGHPYWAEQGRRGAVVRAVHWHRLCLPLLPSASWPQSVCCVAAPCPPSEPFRHAPFAPLQVRCRCGSASDCPGGYRFCAPYCWRV